MFLEVVAEDQDIVQVDDDLVAPDEVAKDTVHHRLEGGRGVCQSEEHHCRLKEPSAAYEGGLVFVSFLDPDVVERPSDVKLGEVLGGLDLVEYVGDER